MTPRCLVSRAIPSAGADETDSGCDEAESRLAKLSSSFMGQSFDANIQETPKNGKFLHVLRLQISRSEEHTSELQSLMRISYAVFCLKKKKNKKTQKKTQRNMVQDNRKERGDKPIKHTNKTINYR